MFDTNLMLLDAATVVGTAAEVTGAWVDMWAVGADLAPQISEYEVAAPPGQGGAIRPLVWTMIVGSAGDNTDAINLHLEFSDDGATEEGTEILFADSLAVASLPTVERHTVQMKHRYVRFVIPAFDSGNTISLFSLGLDDGGEYTDF